MYCSSKDVRDILGLEVTEATDDVVYEYIMKAQAVTIRHVQIRVPEEVVTLDSAGTKFTVSNKYIADVDFDMKITGKDVQVYGWSDSTDPSSKVSLTPLHVYPLEATVTLTEDASSYEKLTVNYSYYTTVIDWDLLRQATSYYAAMLWVGREQFLIPDELIVGNFRMKRFKPWSKLREEFDRLILLLTEIPMAVVHYEKMVMGARQASASMSVTTSLKAEGI